MFTLSTLNLLWILFLPFRPRLVILLLIIDLFSFPLASWPDLKKEENSVHSSGGRVCQSRPRVLQAAEALQAVGEEVLQAVGEGHG